jgi:hypothetical protein
MFFTNKSAFAVFFTDKPSNRSSRSKAQLLFVINEPGKLSLVILLDAAFKKIILDSLSFLTVNERIDVFAFAMMPNHFHVT